MKILNFQFPLRLVLALGSLLAANGWLGAQPVNDQCRGALALQPGVPVTMSTTNATATGDPVAGCASGFGGGVWFTFTPTNHGVVRLSTCGSDFDTVLEVYTGACDTLAPVAGGCNDDEGPACAEFQASVQFVGASGVTYWILAGGAFGESGTMRMVADVVGPPPVNDQCSGAVVLEPSVPFSMSTTNATDTGDAAPMCASGFGGGVWFTFTPTSNSVVRVSTCGSDFDTVLQVYTGACDTLAPVTGGCNDDEGPGCSGLQASVEFLGTGGVSYWIEAGGSGSERGSLRIVADVIGPPPANDQCFGAVALQPGVPFVMSTVHATDTGDPVPPCTSGFGGGVWFSFTPTSNGVVTVSTCGSDFDTVLQVYSGACDALTPVIGGCNDSRGPACPAFIAASVQFLGRGGLRYWILAGGSGGARGNLGIVAMLTAALTNDRCSGAITLNPGLPVTMSTTEATETGDPVPTCQTNFGGGVWFTFKPTRDGVVRVSTCGSGFDTVLQVYTGACDTLAPVAGGCNDSRGPACPASEASVEFVGTHEVTYWILVGGAYGARGNLRIVADVIGPPLANDQCSGAWVLEAGAPFTMSTTNATDTGDPSATCGGGFGGGVWFTFTPTNNGVVRVSTCGSGFDTVLQVHSGACDVLTLVPGGCNDDGGPACSGFQASVQFLGSGGTTYLILVGGSGGARGNLKIVADVIGPPPANDQCSGATALQPGVPLPMSTLLATDTGDPAPTCRTNFGGGVWFTFTATDDRAVTVSTCGSDFDTVLQVYSGACDALTPVVGGCNDSGGPACPIFFPASAQFRGEAGMTYWILAGGSSGARGALKIVVEPMPPANDQCSAAITLQPGVAFLTDTYLAAEAGDPAPTCRTNFGGGVWFTFTPATNGMVRVSTCGSNFDTVLQVHAGACDMLSPVAGGCNDDSGPACSTSQASVEFVGSAGVSYRVLAGGYGGARGTLRIVADYPSPQEPSMTIDVQPGPAILLQIRGAPGQLYTLQVSTNLVNWLNLTNFPAAADGHWSITDTGVTNYPARFYRLTHP